MTKLEENNINAQVSLMKDIIQADKNIHYHIVENAKNAKNCLTNAKLDEDNKIYHLSKDDFENIFEILSNIEKNNYNKLGILAQTAGPERDSKLKILEILQK